MFSKIWTMKSTENYSDNIKRLKQAIDNADAILIGAGAGLSASAGYTYDGVRFQKYFADFNQKYGISDMYSGGFYPYETLRPTAKRSVPNAAEIDTWQRLFCSDDQCRPFISNQPF